VAAVHHFVQRTPVGVPDGSQRPVSGVAERDEKGPGAVLGKAEQFAGELDAGDARVAAADAEVGAGRPARRS